MKNTLTISNLYVSIEQKEIIRGISMAVKSGEVHAVMGPNGSGKSTLAYALMGHPSYVISNQSSVISINAKKIFNLPAEERAKAGLFLAFQSPIAVPGVSVVQLLRSTQEAPRATQNPILPKNSTSMIEFMKAIKKHAKTLHIDEAFLSRGIHDGFSGGEKKKIEMLQALSLAPKFAVFDEIDTGLDVDALKVVARGISLLAGAGTGVIIITHYQRILKYVKPDFVHILVNGTIVKTGGALLAKKIEEHGYTNY